MFAFNWLPIWTPEITFGNAIIILLLVVGYFRTAYRQDRNWKTMLTNNAIATLAAGHSKLSFDASTRNAENIKAAVVAVNTEAADVADRLAGQTPAASELRAVLATELATPKPL